MTAARNTRSGESQHGSPPVRRGQKEGRKKSMARNTRQQRLRKKGRWNMETIEEASAGLLCFEELADDLDELPEEVRREWANATAEAPLWMLQRLAASAGHWSLDGYLSPVGVADLFCID